MFWRAKPILNATYWHIYAWDLRLCMHLAIETGLVNLVLRVTTLSFSQRLE